MIRSKLIWALVWVNVALLLGVALKLTSPAAEAQVPGLSDYLMIPADIPGGNNAVIYVLDTTHGRLTSVNFDHSTGRVSAMPPMDLNQLFQAAGGPSGRPTNNGAY
jgi:hypothetical protein